MKSVILNDNKMSGYTDKLAKLLDGHKCVGQQTIAVSNAAMSLSPPATVPEDKPYFAWIAPIIDSAATNTATALSFTLDGTTPTAAVGLPLGIGGLLVAEGFSQITNFKIVGVEAGKTHSLRVCYFKLGNE